MSICLCKPKRDGTRRCRVPVVNVESSALRCGHEVALERALRLSVVDGVEDRAALEFDAASLVAELRKIGWRVEPPRKAPAVAP